VQVLDAMLRAWPRGISSQREMAFVSLVTLVLGWVPALPPSQLRTRLFRKLADCLQSEHAGVGDWLTGPSLARELG
jgi:hypothetical protein